MTGGSDEKVVQKSALSRFDRYIIGDNFENYLRRLECLFNIDGVTEDEQKIRRLAVYLGDDAESKVACAFLPDKYMEKKWAEVVAKCKLLFTPARRPAVEKDRLHRRSQREGESLMDYAIALQEIAQHCGFDKYLDTALTDRFRSGVRNSSTREKLLNLEDDVKFAKAVEVAKNHERAMMDAVKVHHVGGQESVNHVGGQRPGRQERSRQRERKSFSSGEHQWRDQKRQRSRSSHEVDWKANITCHRCQQKGHFKNECTNVRKKWTKKSDYKNKGNSDASRRHYSNQIAQRMSEMDINGNSGLNRITNGLGYMNVSSCYDGKCNNINDLFSTVGAQIGGIAEVELLVEDQKLRMECDTGSCATVISFEEFKQRFGDKILQPAKKLKAVNGEPLDMRGRASVRVKINSREFQLDLHVIEAKRNFVSLLGRDWLDAIFKDWRKIFDTKLKQVNTVKVNEEFRAQAREELKSSFAKLFDSDM
jgi:Zinc knuckle